MEGAPLYDRWSRASEPIDDENYLRSTVRKLVRYMDMEGLTEVDAKGSKDLSKGKVESIYRRNLRVLSKWPLR